MRNRQSILLGILCVLFVAAERKVLPDDWRIQLNKNNSLYIIGENGNRFRLITNQNIHQIFR